MNKKQLFFNFLYVLLIVGLLIFMVWIVKFMKTEASQCMKDPINYFETKNKGAYCSCMKDGIFYGKTGENDQNVDDLFVIPNK